MRLREQGRVLRARARLIAACVALCANAALAAADDGGPTRPRPGPLDEIATPALPMPLYVVSMMHAEAKPFFVDDRQAFRTHARGLRRLAGVFSDHRAKLAFQPDWTFVAGAQKWDPELFEWLIAQGMGLDAHTHGNQFTVEEVAEQIRACVTEPVGWRVRVGNGDFNRPRPRGANFFWPFCRPWQDSRAPYLDAICAYKDAQPQDSDASGVVWRPALHGDWHVHDPTTPIVYIGGGPLGAVRGDFTVLQQAVEISLRHLRPGCINVLYWHDSLHQYHSTTAINKRVNKWEQALAETFDPLAAVGIVRWATFAEILDAYLELEASPQFALQPGEVIEQIDAPLDTPTTLGPVHP